MKLRAACVLAGLLSLALSQVQLTVAQTTTETGSALPRLVRFSGTVKDLNGNPLTGVVGITFALYSEQAGGGALWLETQNVTADSNGHYVALLGSTKLDGLPTELFTSGQARWVGVQVSGQAEQPRVLLVSAPYALKAGDAETVGGLPPSAFVLTARARSFGGTAASTGSPAAQSPVPAVTGTGTTNYIPLWFSSTKLGNSKLFQSTAGNIGVGTITPGATLDVNGAVNAGTSYNLGGTAFAFGSYGSQNAFLGFAGNSTITGNANTASGWAALGFNTTGSFDTASGYQALLSNTTGTNNTANGSSALQNNNTGSGNTASGAAALLTNTTGGGNTAAGVSALYSNTTGGQNTANGQNALFSNTTGGGNTASGWDALYSNTTAQQNTANGFESLFLNTTGSQNTAIGQNSLYSNTTGGGNTASGYGALYSNTTAQQNTANGFESLFLNTTGFQNTAIGQNSLYSNTTGGGNTASGYGALYFNTAGSNNTALGVNAGPDSSSTGLTNATAIGANATVSQSNALVLGGTGSNAVNVGIGTPTPAFNLDVHGTANFTGKINFASGQTFPGTGTITGITTASGSGLSGGGTTGTLSLKVPSAGITNSMLADSKITLNASTAGGLTVPGTMTLGDTYTIGLKTCSANQVLEYVGTAWTCSNAGTGTITGVTAGTDLTGGGTSGTVTLNLDTTKVPQLNSANIFTANQTVNANLGVTGAATITGIGSFIASTGSAQLIVNSGGSGTTTTGAIAGNSSTTSGSGGLYLAASNAVLGGNNNNTGLLFVGPNWGQWEQGPSSTGGKTNFMSIAMNSTTTAAQNISFNTPTGVPVQTGRYGGNYTNTLDDGNNNMSVLGWIWQKGRNYLQSNPPDPTGTSSTSFQMMGLGSALTLTPAFSGTVMIRIDSGTKNTVDGNGIQFEIFYGTGTAPSNGSPTTGILVGPTFERDFWGPNATVGFGTNLKIPGLTVGTAYWFDIALRSLGSGSSDATIQKIEFYIEEI